MGVLKRLLAKALELELDRWQKEPEDRQETGVVHKTLTLEHALRKLNLKQAEFEMDEEGDVVMRIAPRGLHVGDSFVCGECRKLLRAGMMPYTMVNGAKQYMTDTDLAHPGIPHKEERPMITAEGKFKGTPVSVEWDDKQVKRDNKAADADWADYKRRTGE